MALRVNTFCCRTLLTTAVAGVVATSALSGPTRGRLNGIDRTVVEVRTSTTSLREALEALERDSNQILKGRDLFGYVSAAQHLEVYVDTLEIDSTCPDRVVVTVRMGFLDTVSIYPQPSNGPLRHFAYRWSYDDIATCGRGELMMKVTELVLKGVRQFASLLSSEKARYSKDD